MMITTLLRCVGGLALTFGLINGNAHAAPDFYKGKQINFIVSADGAYDAFARMIARHWGR